MRGARFEIEPAERIQQLPLPRRRVDGGHAIDQVHYAGGNAAGHERLGEAGQRSPLMVVKQARGGGGGGCGLRRRRRLIRR